MARRTGLKLIGAFGAALALLLSGCAGGTTEGGGGASDGSPQSGGAVVDLLEQSRSGGWPSGLDPATNYTGLSNLPQQHAIFGGLFLLRADDDGTNVRIEPYQAESGEMSDDGRTLTIKLRPGITFSDGTAMDAEAVIWNFERAADSVCVCAPTWPLRAEEPFTSPDPLTVEVHFNRPYFNILNAFPVLSVNWIASPTAFEKAGEEEFKITPVGAGPFVVVSNELSSKLVLKKNDDYFVEGQPYLDELTFQSVKGDQPAYQALLAGSAQSYEGATLLPLIKQAEAQESLNVTAQPLVGPLALQLNTMEPPFNDKRAREAMYLATNFAALNDGLYDGRSEVVQSFSAPGSMFQLDDPAGYLTYDLEKAKEVVAELGGLRVIVMGAGAPQDRAIYTALQTQWEQAGIDVELALDQQQAQIKSGEWGVTTSRIGGWDPAVGVGLEFRFGSESAYTSTKDPQLDEMMASAAELREVSERQAAYQEIAQYLSDERYVPFGFPIGTYQISTKNLHAPGLTTLIPPMAINTAVIWAEAWLEKE